MTEPLSTWKLVFDSVTGTSHESNDTPCQDCCRVVTVPGSEEDILIAVCADGAGSAEHSDTGSQLACDQFIELCQTYISNESISEVSTERIVSWLISIREILDTKAEELEVESRQLATTLLGCVITPSDSIFVQIGDGAMLFRCEQEFEYAFWPHSGEYANTTNFLTSDDYLDKFEWRMITDRVNELVAFTDGLERLILKFEDQSIHEPAIIPMLEVVRKSETGEEFFEPLRSFLNSNIVNERTDDDKTLVLATRLRNHEATC